MLIIITIITITIIIIIIIIIIKNSSNNSNNNISLVGNLSSDDFTIKTPVQIKLTHINLLYKEKIQTIGFNHGAPELSTESVTVPGLPSPEAFRQLLVLKYKSCQKLLLLFILE